MKKFEQFTNQFIFGITYYFAEGPEYCTKHEVMISKKGEDYEAEYEGPLPKEIEKSMEKLGLEDEGENRWSVEMTEISKEDLIDELNSIGLEYDEEYEKIQQELNSGGYNSLEDWVEQNS